MGLWAVGYPSKAIVGQTLEDNLLRIEPRLAKLMLTLAKLS